MAMSEKLTALETALEETALEEEARQWTEKPGLLNPDSPLAYSTSARAMRYAAEFMHDEWFQLPKTREWCDMTTAVMHMTRQLRRLAAHYYVTAGREIERVREIKVEEIEAEIAAEFEPDEEPEVLAYFDDSGAILPPGVCSVNAIPEGTKDKPPVVCDPAKHIRGICDCDDCDHQVCGTADQCVNPQADDSYHVEEVITTRSAGPEQPAVDVKLTGIYAATDEKSRLLADIERLQGAAAESAIHNSRKDRIAREEAARSRDMARSEIYAINGHIHNLREAAKGCPRCTISNDNTLSHCQACKDAIAVKSRCLFNIEAEQLGIR